MDLERSFGTTSQSQQRLQGFPLRLQAQENDGADKLFLHGINKPGVFEKEISSLDEKDGDTVGRLLCWAALTNQHPDVINRLHEKCGDFSATLRGYPPLVCAVINGHASAVKQILDLGAPVNAITKGRRDFGFCTALHSAVGISDAGIVNDLLEAGAKVDFADDLGKTALHHACDIAAVDVAVELLKRGADVNKGDRTLKTPVHIAVAANSYPLLTSLVRLGKKPSALAAASFVEQCRGEKGREEMFELLVEHKWGPRYRKTPGGNSPLTGTPVSAAPAASAAPADVKGDPSSSPRAPTPSSGSGLHQAAKTGDLDRLKELLSSGEDPSAQGVGGVSPLHLAARLGHVEVVQALLRAEAAPDARDKNSLTPLLTAAKAGKAAVVAALIAGGANPDLKDSKECSALGIAVQFRFHAVVQALVDGKASVNAGGEKGCTPLHVACDLGSAATVDTLLSAGALAGHCWNDALKSPLMVACGAGHLDVVNVLLPKLSKRQINMRDRVTGVEEGGVTALLFAIECSRGGMDIVQALLDNGADPNVRVSPSNVSALDHVVVCDNTRSEPTLGPRMVRALIKAGAKVDEMGSQGCTPLHQACLEGACGEVVQALLDAGADASAPCAGFMFMTPLQLAGCGGNPGALRVMIGLPECGGLDTVGAPPERATVLASAVRYGQAEGVRFLLEEGADMDLLPFEEDGITLRAKSLVHLAMAEGHGDVVRLLLQARQYRRESELLAGGV